MKVKCGEVIYKTVVFCGQKYIVKEEIGNKNSEKSIIRGIIPFNKRSLNVISRNQYISETDI